MNTPPPVQVLGNRVLAELVGMAEISKGGIFTPEVVRNNTKAQEAIITLVGDGDKIPQKLKDAVGRRVFIGQFSGMPFIWEKRKYSILVAEDIVLLFDQVAPMEVGQVDADRLLRLRTGQGPSGHADT